MPSLSASALPAQTFLSGIGVNTHIPYTDGGYANIGNVISQLRYLGVTEVRDSPSNGEFGSAPLSSFITVAQAGVHFTLTLRPSTTAAMDATLGLIRQIQAAAPGGVAAVEGPNEINNQPLSFNGVDGLTGALNLQTALYGKVHADPGLAGVAVDYFTGWGAGGVPVGPNPVAAGIADYNNQHPYPPNQQAPAHWVARSTTLPNSSDPTTPTVYTETGYSANLVGASLQAKYTLDLLFDAAKQGIAKTYLYELMDGYSPGSPQGNAGWGLFDYTNQPKPAASAIHNLTTILGGGGAASALPSGLDFQISGLPATGDWLVLAKPNGAFDLVLWAESPGSSATATISFSQAIGAYSLYDPLVGTGAITSGGPTSSLSVTVSDHPVIVELQGAGPTTPTTPPTGQPNTIVGTEGADSLSAAHATTANLIQGNGGPDSITGGDGGDTLQGGSGDDLINGGAGADSIDGGPGQTLVFGRGGGDSFHPSSGERMTIADFNAYEGDRVRLDGAAQPSLTQVANNVVIDPGGGTQVILYNMSLSVLQQGPAWLVLGGATAPTPPPPPTPPTAPPSGQPNTLVGTEGPDSLTAAGSATHNLIQGLGGADSITGGDAGDTLQGGSGDDLINGGAGADSIDGGPGQTLVFGRGGGDSFHPSTGERMTIADFNGYEGDRVLLDAAAQPSLTQVSNNVVIDPGGGTQVTLYNMSLSVLQNTPGWLVLG